MWPGNQEAPSRYQEDQDAGMPEQLWPWLALCNFILPQGLDVPPAQSGALCPCPSKDMGWQPEAPYTGSMAKSQLPWAADTGFLILCTARPLFICFGTLDISPKYGIFLHYSSMGESSFSAREERTHSPIPESPVPEEMKERGWEDSLQFLICRSEDNPELFTPYETESWKSYFLFFFNNEIIFSDMFWKSSDKIKVQLNLPAFTKWNCIFMGKLHFSNGNSPIKVLGLTLLFCLYTQKALAPSAWCGILKYISLCQKRPQQ